MLRAAASGSRLLPTHPQRTSTSNPVPMSGTPLPLRYAAKGAAGRLRSRQRANREALFADGVLRLRLADDERTDTREAFLADPKVTAFGERLQKAFHGALAAVHHFQLCLWTLRHRREVIAVGG